jgi:flagellin
VTSLLNRAVTLATEASNGTLNTSQDAAANQEYQSILSEVNNIGSTTTYNGTAVFGKSTDIYTGDSTATGASVDDLNIAALSSGSVGDTAGAMAYSSGQSVFINMSTASQNAQSTDSITAASTLTDTYEVGGTAGGTATITAGTETVSGLMAAINNSGLGLTATFTTKAAATGVASATGDETGIQITGAVNSTGATATQAELAVGVGDIDLSTTSAGAVTAGGTGTATISYSDGAGQALSSSSLTSQANAEASLTSLNAAITDVAAQDGYVGAQINTLNAVSSVLSTQQENVTSAQNAVQATDYASATSNMSKYEILSQTGISALAQANSMSQEVTKLLQ